MQVRDPVHDYIELTRTEVQVINAPVFQRLRRIRQLALAHLVYPGAQHSRFEHSLGVCHVAGRMARLLDLESDDEKLVRLAALLHDLGHGPFSHVSEFVLQRFVDKDKVPGGKTEKIHELITNRLIKHDPVLRDSLGKTLVEDIAQLLEEGYGTPVLKAIVSGPVDADKQDYLLRDGKFCGVSYGVFDIGHLHRAISRFGSDTDTQLAVKRHGVHALEQFALAKYYLTKAVYRHKVRLIADQMIVRAIVLGVEVDEIEELVSLYSFEDSDEFYDRYVGADDLYLMRLCQIDGTKCGELMLRLWERRLLKRVFVAEIKELEAQARELLPDIQTRSDDLRRRMEEAIAGKLSEVLKADFDPHLVVVDSYSFKSVRETAKDDESGILILPNSGSSEPKKFDEESVLFRSIQGEMKERFVAVYAPAEWKNPAEREKTMNRVHGPLKDLINEICREAEQEETDEDV